MKGMNEPKIYLIGAGPGDPELITLKAKRVLAEADCVLYDHLTNRALLHYCKKECEQIYVGKSAGKHILPQEAICELLVEKTESCATIVRLKGGDPFIFGRGSEEALTLVSRNIPFEVIPGISSGAAAPAYAGIPLTHRGISSSVAFITGHEDPTKTESAIDWEKISTGVDTLVFFMGVKNRKVIVQNLIENGRDPETPAAIIENGTTGSQRVISTSLRELLDQAEAAGVRPPAIIIVGNVVALRKQLDWFGPKPLRGKKIVVTRSRAQASKLSMLLSAYGADAIEYPVVRFAYPEKTQDLTHAIERIQEFDWVFFTSTNGVDYFFEAFLKSWNDIRALGNCKIASMGSATSAAIVAHNLFVDFQPTQYVAETFVEEFAKQHVCAGMRILLVHSDKARAYIETELQKQGADVEAVVPYETLIETDPGHTQELDNLAVEMVTFTSSSTVHNFFSLYSGPKKFKIASIGPITSKTIQEHGYTVDVEAREYTIPGLVQSIVDYF